MSTPAFDVQVSCPVTTSTHRPVKPHAGCAPKGANRRIANAGPATGHSRAERLPQLLYCLSCLSTAPRARNNFLWPDSRQADSSSFRHPCTRAVAVVVLRCFKSKQAPASFGQFAAQDFRTPTRIHSKHIMASYIQAKEHSSKRVTVRPWILSVGR